MLHDERIGDRYRIERVAGRGGMGVVYRAHDERTGRPVAVKVVDVPSERFSAEAGLLAELRHPAIVGYIGYGTTPSGQAFIAMEWVEGEDLAQRLARGALTLEETLALARRLASALAVAHARGVVHRDLKPSNVILGAGRVDDAKLLDFGVARIVDARRAPTRTGVLLGTPGFMAPEQVRGDRSVDARADVFALGCILFECLTGTPAFPGTEVFAILAKVVLDDVPRLADRLPWVSPELDALVARMLARDRSERPADGSAVLEALDALPAAGAAPGPLPGAPARPALTVVERRVGSVVLARLGAPEPPAADLGTAPTVASGGGTVVSGPAPLDAIRQALEPLGVSVVGLVQGGVVAVPTGPGTATDHAKIAARCALALRRLLPDIPVVVTTGRAVATGRFAVGDALERGANLLASTPAAVAAIPIDEVTAGLLDANFDIAAEGDGFALRGERTGGGATRTLLGRPTPCVGRARELGVLDSLLSECIEESVARVVLVVGAPGIGKSRLLWEFERHVTDAGSASLWSGRGEVVAAGAPFAMLGQLLACVAGFGDASSADVRARRLRARMGRHMPAAEADRAAAFLGEVVGAPSERGPASSLRSAPDALADHARVAWEDFVVAECRAKPVVVVLEDLHWGDLPTVQYIGAALRRAAELPLLVVAVARPEVHTVFPSLWEERQVHRLALGELTRRASDKLVREVLGASADDRIVERIVEQGGGNAFYLEELIRAVAEGRGDALPDTVLAMVESRLDGLRAELRRVVRAAAIFGRSSWLGALRALLGERDSREVVAAWLDELCTREVFDRRVDGATFRSELEVVFRHATLQQAAYETLTDEDRRLGHRLAGEWLERHGHLDPQTLATHFERGGSLERAAGFYLAAAERALRGSDLAGAVDTAQRGLACGGTGDERAALHLVCCEAEAWRGRFAEALPAGERALDAAAPGTVLWFRATVHVAHCAQKLAAVERSRELARRLLTTEPVSPAAAAEADVARVRVSLYLHFIGCMQDADALLAASTPGAGGGYWLAIGAFRARQQGDIIGFARLSREAARAFESDGRLRDACLFDLNGTGALTDLGLWAEAEEGLRTALATAERLQIDGVLGLGWSNLASVLTSTGRSAEALPMALRAVDVYAAQRNLRMEGAARQEAARALRGLGRLEEAEQHARRSLELLEGFPPTRIETLATFSRILLERGRADEALDAAREAIRLTGEVGPPGTLGQMHLAFARALAATGHHEEAAAAARAGAAALQAIADRMGDEERRRAFLEQVEENAALLELARSS